MSQEINEIVEKEISFHSKDLFDDHHLDKHIQNVLYPTKVFPPPLTEQEKTEMDSRSIHVSNVDYSSTVTQLEEFFKSCGPVNKITIPVNKYNGHPKGFAYIEFSTTDAVDLSMLLDESEFNGRKIQVNPKRTNIPGYSTTNRPPRRGRGRGMTRNMSNFRGRKAISTLKQRNNYCGNPY